MPAAKNTSQTAAALAAAYPTYADTAAIDDLRTSDYARLDAQGHIYLDYTGAGLYAISQLEAHMQLLHNSVLGNPHSLNPTSKAATDLMEQCRAAVLRFFNADPQEYEAIFTTNASGALKLVGEAYPFDADGHYLLTFDNHNSVNGIREYARARHTTITYIPLELPDLRVDETQLAGYLSKANPQSHNLFAYPAQSNFSGVQHPLEWIAAAQSQGWDVLLDAAAFVPTNRLDLGQVHPDFVDLSFYKMFGYPTGVGCLLARREALAKLRRPWFSGGTVIMASINIDSHKLAEGPAAFEDGTVNYLSLPAVEIGLHHLDSIGIDIIHERVRCLTGWLIDQLLALQHSNGKPLVQLYGPPNTTMRGGALAFNFYGADSQLLNHFAINHHANSRQISLRTGAFCNPGGGEIALGLASDQHLECIHPEDDSLIDFSLVFDEREMGALRVSLGLVSNVADIQHLIEFAQSFLT